jgi:DNA-binding MarR family transcriptional regulator
MDKQSVQSIRLQSGVANVHCAHANLRRAGRAVAQLYDQFLAPSDLQITQFNVLAACAALGPVPISTLADPLVVDRTTLLRRLKPLKTRGLIRVTKGKDRRVHIVALRKKGYETLNKALPLWQDAQSQMMEGFGRKRLDKLLQELRAIVQLARQS